MPARTVYPPPVPTAQPDGDVRPQSATEAPLDRDINANPPADEPGEVSPVEIASEAYARYVARGREDGHDVEDWLAAERSLRQRATVRPADRQDTDIGYDEPGARRFRESEDDSNA
jgi:hypothetical protein